MLVIVASILAAAFLPGVLNSPYPFPNSTIPGNYTYPNNTIGNITEPAKEYHCVEVYPADLSVVNARYPDYNTTHLHVDKQFFMLRREIPDVGEIATRIQFQGLPLANTNLTCRLEFILPQLELQIIQGFNPSFNVYQVERNSDSMASWNTYEGNLESVDLFGQVNGEPSALERTRSVGGVAAINQTACNQTLTFQMGMAFNSRGGVPNYWEFSQVSPPAWPVQGFRIVYGC